MTSQKAFAFLKPLSSLSLLMKPIDRVYILCNIRDVHLARICVASIRYFYPDVAISVVTDQHNGAFDASDIEHYGDGVEVAQVQNRAAGQGYVKLEILADPRQERVLILDADIIFAGPVLEELAKHEEDIIICPERPAQPDDERWRFTYYKPDLAQQVRPEFVFPGVTFNSGQIVATTGKIPLSFWDEFAEYTQPVKLKQFEAFRTDQGLYNFAFYLLQQEGKLSIGEYHFHYWGFGKHVQDITLEQVKRKDSPAKIIHWAGPKPTLIKNYPGAELLQFFEDLYYAQVPNGATKRRQNALQRIAMELYAKAYFRLTGKHRYV